MSFLLILVVIFISFILLFLWVKHCLFVRDILWNFKHCNVIVFGKKGTGKDLIFQYVINKRKDYYYSNISYGGDYKNVKLKDVSCAPNDYNKIVNDEIIKSKHLFKENKDIYI